MSFLEILARQKKSEEQKQQQSHPDSPAITETTSASSAPTTSLGVTSPHKNNNNTNNNQRTDSQQYFSSDDYNTGNNNSNNTTSDEYEYEVYAIHNTDHLTVIHRKDSSYVDVQLAGFARLPKLSTLSTLSSSSNNNSHNNNNNNKLCDPFAWEAREVLRKNFLGRPVHLTEIKVPTSNNYSNNNSNNNNNNFPMQKKATLYHVTRSDGESVVSCLVKRGLAECRTNFLTYSLSGKYNTSTFTQDELHQIEAKLKQSQDEAKKSKIGMWSYDASNNEGRALDTVVQTTPFPPRDDLFRIEMIVASLVGRWVKVSIEKCASCHMHEAVVVSSLQEIKIKIAGLIASENSSIYKEGRLRISKRLLHRTVELKLAAYDRSCACFIAAFRDERPERLVRDGLALIDRRTIQFARDPDALLAESSHAIRHGAGIYANHTITPQILEGVDFTHIFSPEQHEFLAQVVGVPGEATVTVKPLNYFLRNSTGNNNNNNSENNNNNAPFLRDDSTCNGGMMSPAVTNNFGLGGCAYQGQSSSTIFSPSSTSLAANINPENNTIPQVESFLSQIAKKHLPPSIDINLAFIHEDIIGASYYGASSSKNNNDDDYFSSENFDSSDPNFYHTPKDRSDFAYWVKHNDSTLVMETTRAAFSARQYLRHLLVGKTVVVKPICCCPNSSFSVSPTQESSSAACSSLVPSSSTLLVSSRELTLFGEILVLGQRDQLIPQQQNNNNNNSNNNHHHHRNNIGDNEDGDNDDDGDEVVYGKQQNEPEQQKKSVILDPKNVVQQQQPSEEEFIDVATILVYQNKIPFPRLSNVSVYGSKNVLTSYANHNNNNNKDMILPCFLLSPPTHLTQFVENEENNSVILHYRKAVVNKELQKAVGSTLAKKSDKSATAVANSKSRTTLALYRKERNALEYFTTPVMITKPNHANEETLSNILVFPPLQPAAASPDSNTSNNPQNQIEKGKVYHASIESCEDDLTSFELLLLPDKMYSHEDSSTNEDSLFSVHAKLAYVEIFTSAFSYYDECEQQQNKNSPSNQNNQQKKKQTVQANSSSSLLVSAETLKSCKQTLKFIKERIMMNQYRQDPFICVRFHEVAASSFPTKQKTHEYSVLMCIKIDVDQSPAVNSAADPRQLLQQVLVNNCVCTDFPLNVSILKLGLGFLRDTNSCLSTICTVAETKNNNNSSSDSNGNGESVFSLNATPVSHRSNIQKYSVCYLEAVREGRGVWNIIDDIELVNQNYKNKNRNNVTNDHDEDDSKNLQQLSRIRSEFEANPFRFLPNYNHQQTSNSQKKSETPEALHGKLVRGSLAANPKLKIGLVPTIEISPFFTNNITCNKFSAIPHSAFTDATILGVSPVSGKIIILRNNDQNVRIIYDALSHAKLRSFASFDDPFFTTSLGKTLIVGRFDPRQDGCAFPDLTPQRAILQNVYQKSVTLGSSVSATSSSVTNNSSSHVVLGHTCCSVRLVDAANDGLIEIDDVSMLKEIVQVDTSYLQMYHEQQQRQQQQKNNTKHHDDDGDSFLPDEDDAGSKNNNLAFNNNQQLPPPEILQQMQYDYDRMCSLLNIPSLVTGVRPAFVVDHDEKKNGNNNNVSCRLYKSDLGKRLQFQAVLVLPLYQIRTPSLSIVNVLTTDPSLNSNNENVKQSNSNNNDDDDDDGIDLVQQMKNGRNQRNVSKKHPSNKNQKKTPQQHQDQQQQPKQEQHFQLDCSNVDTYVLLKPNPSIGRQEDIEQAVVAVDSLMAIPNYCLIQLHCDFDSLSVELLPTIVSKSLQP